MKKTAGQKAYEAEVKSFPLYHDGTVRKSWSGLKGFEKETWKKNPTPRRLRKILAI